RSLPRGRLDNRMASERVPVCSRMVAHAARLRQAAIPASWRLVTRMLGLPQPRSARASHVERQQFGVGPGAGATEHAAELQRASVTAGIDTEVAPRRLLLSFARSRS